MFDLIKSFFVAIHNYEIADNRSSRHEAFLALLDARVALHKGWMALGDSKWMRLGGLFGVGGFYYRMLDQACESKSVANSPAL